jgi:hypothetical protein
MGDSTPFNRCISDDDLSNSNGSALTPSTAATKRCFDDFEEVGAFGFMVFFRAFPMMLILLIRWCDQCCRDSPFLRR